MGRSGGRVPAMASCSRGQSWVSWLRCVGCGELWSHVELSEYDDDEPYGWPLAEPCPRCRRLGMMRKVES